MGDACKGEAGMGVKACVSVRVSLESSWCETKVRETPACLIHASDDDIPLPPPLTPYRILL